MTTRPSQLTRNTVLLRAKSSRRLSRRILPLCGIAGFIITVLGFPASAQDTNPLHNRPFWNTVIEVNRGASLILRPLLPYVPDVPEEEYTLILNLPKGISPQGVYSGFDVQSRIDSVKEELRKCRNADSARMELIYQPDLTLARHGLELTFLYSSKHNSGMAGYHALGYVPTMNFVGTFDWKTFTKQIRVPTSGDILKPGFITWSRLDGGAFQCRRVLIKETGTSNIVYDYHPEKPVRIDIEKGKQTNVELPVTDKLVPGTWYTLVCEAKGNDITSSVTTVKEGLEKTPHYTRAMFFDVSPDIKLPDKLCWRVEDAKGKCFRQGEVALTAARERIAPKQLDTSVWICETSMPCEKHTVQSIYLNRLYAWGLNAIEPFVNELLFGQDITDDAVSVPMALEAKQLGMKVRSYLRFIYASDRAFFKIHPEGSPVGPNGASALGARGNAMPCITYLLEGDKQAGIGGGTKNPWLGFQCDVIRQSVKLNKLDGIFFDWELSGAPFVKAGILKVGIPLAIPRKWQNDLCMCPRCLKAFADYIKSDHIPSREECWEKHYDEWVDFRCKQFIRFWDIIRQAGRDVNSSLTFGIYSSVPPCTYDLMRQLNAVDWRLTAAHIDYGMGRWGCADVGATGCMRSLKRLITETQTGQPPPKMLAQLFLYYFYSFNGWGWQWQDALINVKNNIVKCVAVGESFGWSICGLPGVDDQLGGPLREAHALLAEHEDYFVNGFQDHGNVLVKTGDVTCATWKKGKDMISFVFNDTDSTQNIIICNTNSDYVEARLSVPAHETVVKKW